MADKFAVDAANLQQLSQNWNSEAQQVEQLPQQLSTIESHLGTLLENTLATDALNFVLGGEQLAVWFDLRSKLKDAAGMLNTLAQQLGQDSETLKRCAVEYQIADDAAANGITNIQAALNSNAPGSTQIRALLNTLSGSDAATAESTAQSMLGTPPTTTPGGGSTTTSGTGTGGGGGSTGGGGGGGGGSTGGGGGSGVNTTQDGSADGGGGTTTAGGGGIADTSGGDWQTTGNWTAGINGPRTGQGMRTTLPDYSSLPAARQQIMSNMEARVRHKIGYSQSAYTDGYRDDCSGSVSAAWGLSKPGTNCIGLMGSSVSHRITKDDLQPGDAMIASDHVVLFGGWANAQHTQYYALEDDGSDGTVAHVIPYPYWSHNGVTDGGTYEPYRKNGVS
ncbi:MAG TPA: hypothetical protein VL551_05765 [Actinospica sp.]|jgi:hypothetical protein|nr:hypothetical protein [Actinospica sp.]